MCAWVAAVRSVAYAVASSELQLSRLAASGAVPAAATRISGRLLELVMCSPSTATAPYTPYDFWGLLLQSAEEVRTDTECDADLAELLEMLALADRVSRVPAAGEGAQLVQCRVLSVVGGVMEQLARRSVGESAREALTVLRVTQATLRDNLNADADTVWWGVVRAVETLAAGGAGREVTQLAATVLRAAAEGHKAYTQALPAPLTGTTFAQGEDVLEISD